MVDEDTVFNPILWVNEGEKCTIIVAEDNFECSHTPGVEVCPSAQIEVATTGTHQVGILSEGDCRGDEGHYELIIDADSDPGLTQIHDSEPIDPDDLGKKFHSLNSEGSGTLLRE